MSLRRCVTFALLTVSCAGEPTVVAPSSAPAAAPGPTPSASAPAPWTYSGPTGTERWGDLDPAYAACARGAQQSPIDLPRQGASHPELGPVGFHWDPAPLSVVNTGHTVQVEDSARSTLVLDGVIYSLVQFHFHTPAEHTIEGRMFDAELHLVHRSPEGRVAVVAVLFRAGAENPVLAPLVRAAPARRGPGVVVPGKTIDVEALVPRAPRFAAYDGSLTAPPCTEGVRWLVTMPEAEPSELSPTQLDVLRAAMRAPTNRPIQPRNGRDVVVRVGAAAEAR